MLIMSLIKMEYTFERIIGINIKNNKLLIRWSSWETSWIEAKQIVVGRDSFNRFIGEMIDHGLEEEDVDKIIKWMIKYYPAK